MNNLRLAQLAAGTLLVSLFGCGGSADQPARPSQFAPQLFASSGQSVVAADYTTLVQALYVAYFGRPADVGGMANFSSQLAEFGVAPNVQALIGAYSRDSRVKALIDSFAASPESAALYGGDNNSFVTGIYQNLFGRAPDSGGLAFWVGAINSGQLSRARASLDIVAGALHNTSAQGALDAVLINKKIDIAATFTGALSNASQAGYSGNAAAARGRSLLAGLQATSSTTADSTALTAAVNDMAAMGGGWTYSAAYVNVSQSLHVLYFGRPASPGELSTLSNALKNAAAPLTLVELDQAYATNTAVRNVIEAFAQTKEWKDQFPSSGYVGDDFTFVKAIYNNLFNHNPDIATWESLARGLASSGVSRGKLAVSIAAGAKGADADLAMLKFKTAASFTSAITTGTAPNTYIGPVAHAIGGFMLQEIASVPDSAGMQALLNSTAQTLGNMASGTFTEEAAIARRVVLLVGADQAMLQATRLSTLTNLLTADLNGKLGPRGPRWSVEVVAAASTAQLARQQLLNAHSAILIGDVPLPKFWGQIYHPAYQFPACRFMGFYEGGMDVTLFNSPIEAEPTCHNGVAISYLRGTTSATQTAEISRKLDQMINYHRDSQASNANWDRGLTFVAAAWSDGVQWANLTPIWDSMPMFSQSQATTVNTGSGAQRRAAFLNCLSRKTEVCSAVAHGLPAAIDFEGPGTKGQFYSTDSVRLLPAEVAAQRVAAKYVETASCSTHDFSNPNSFGTTLLMAGDALLTSGFTSTAWISNDYVARKVKNHYLLLNAGANFAEAWFGGGENEAAGFQGDPFITMRPIAAPAKRPVLVVNGKHYNSGSDLATIDLPDSLDARRSSKLMVLSNRGAVDLHVRIDTMVLNTGADNPTGAPLEYEYGHNAQYVWGRMVTMADGRLSDPVSEMDGGRLSLTIRPGESASYYYHLEVRTGADGKPKRPGLYSGRVSILSDDPASGRLRLTLRARVR